MERLIGRYLLGRQEGLELVTCTYIPDSENGVGI